MRHEMDSRRRPPPDDWGDYLFWFVMGVAACLLIWAAFTPPKSNDAFYKEQAMCAKHPEAVFIVGNVGSGCFKRYTPEE